MRFIQFDPQAIMPKRQTKGSAGYDFYSPVDVLIPPHSTVEFGTGIKAEIDEGYVLLLFIRSSLGRNKITLTNGTGVVDSDYRDEMKAFLRNDSDNAMTIRMGDRYMQGVIVPFALMDDDEATEERKGGVGSTGKR